MTKRAKTNLLPTGTIRQGCWIIGMRFHISLLGLLALILSAAAQTVYTPKPGSPERQAVCDALREFLAKNYAQSPLPQPIVFKIDTIRIQDGFCFFQGLPIFKDGSDVVPRYMADVGYYFCLKQDGKGWKVVFDLSRSDVPADAEAREIKRKFPADFPVSLLPELWRDLFKKLR